ncbi:hypothetical protein RFI_27999, partial [Reticulomyxa filosa]
LREKASQEGKQLEEIIPPEVKQKMSVSDYLMAPCVRIIGNVVSGTDEQTAEVVKAGFFKIIEACVDHPIKNIKKEACWALSNVIAGTKEQLELFYENTTLVKLRLNIYIYFIFYFLFFFLNLSSLKIIDLCMAQGDINIRKEAGWCLSNAICHASIHQLKILVEYGFIEAMVRLMECRSEKVVVIAMDALQACFELYQKNFNIENMDMHPLVAKMEGLGGLNLLEEIQGIEEFSAKCCNDAADFVTKYWPVNDAFTEDNGNRDNNDNHDGNHDGNNDGIDSNNNDRNDDIFLDSTDKNNNEIYQF